MSPLSFTPPRWLDQEEVDALVQEHKAQGRRWRWYARPSSLGTSVQALISPSGHVAAHVQPAHTGRQWHWIIFDRSGSSGENDIGADEYVAKHWAANTAKTLYYENGWESPTADLAGDLPRASLDLIRAAVASAGQGCPKAPRWSHVGRMFGLGSGSSSGLCRFAGLGSDEEVGASEWQLAEDVLGELDDDSWREAFGCDPPPMADR